MKYVPPGDRDSIVTVQPRYDNFIGGKWLAPVEGRFRVNLSPATARPICEVADSTPQDIELRGARHRHRLGPGRRGRPGILAGSRPPGSRPPRRRARRSGAWAPPAGRP